MNPWTAEPTRLLPVLRAALATGRHESVVCGKRKNWSTYPRHARL